MKNPVRLLVCLPILVGGALAATAARAQVTQKGDEYEFHIKTRQGMKINYLIRANSTPPAAGAQSPAKPISVITPVMGVVTSAANKVITIKFTSGPPTVNGQQQGEPRDIEVKVDDRGRPIGAPAPGLENLLGNLPNKPLKIGDTYALKQSISFAGIPLSVNTHYTFRGLKSVNGERCADFKVAISGSGSLPTPQGASAAFKIQGAGAMQISVADGLTAHSSADLDVVIAQGNPPAKLKVKTTIDRK